MSLSLADIDKFMDDMQANARADPELLYIKPATYRHLLHIYELKAKGKSYVPSKRMKRKSLARMPKDLREEAREYRSRKREKRGGIMDSMYWTRTEFLDAEGKVIDEPAFP